MKVSVITPTEERKGFLNLLHRCLCAQSHVDWEWLIYDTSFTPQPIEDPKIHYFHSDERITIGEKRNRLIHAAKGEVIVHCDDDDYYAPLYLETALKALEKADLFTIDAWFNYHLNTQQIYYWGAEQSVPTHFVVDPVTGMRTREIDFGPHLSCQGAKLVKKARNGYGFSYAYYKNVTEICPFPDLDLGEDQRFFESAEEKGFRSCSLADQKGLVMHVVHETNTSCIYPQYRVPRFLAEPLFPAFFASLPAYLSNISHIDTQFSL